LIVCSKTDSNLIINKKQLKIRFSGILLIFALMLPFVGTFWMHKIQKKQIKRTIKRKIIAGIDKDELVLLKFTEKEKETQLRWEHSKEFEYQGEMYDITASQTVGDTTYFWCWWDFEETKLNKQLGHLVAGFLDNNSENQDRQIKLFDFLNSIFYTEFHFEFNYFLFEKTQKHFNFIGNFKSILVFSKPPPP